MVTPGFWNCHVHFTEPKWSNAGEQAEAALAQHLRDMVTSHGFTSVVDTGSDPVNTLALRRRIEAGLRVRASSSPAGASSARRDRPPISR